MLTGEGRSRTPPRRLCIPVAQRGSTTGKRKGARLPTRRPPSLLRCPPRGPVQRNSGGSVLRGGARRNREPTPPVARHAQDSHSWGLSCAWRAGWPPKLHLRASRLPKKRRVSPSARRFLFPVRATAAHISPPRSHPTAETPPPPRPEAQRPPATGSRRQRAAASFSQAARARATVR